MSATIRIAAPADAELVLRFIQGLAEYEHQADAVKATEATLRAQMLESPAPFECLIAERDGEPAGFALFFRNYSTWSGLPGLYIEDLFVLERHRRHGVGRALLKRLAAITVERGWARMEWAVLEWNGPAKGFYRGFGATAKDEWRVWRLEGEALARAARR